MVNIRIHDIGDEGLEVQFVKDESWGEHLPPHERVSARLYIERSGEYIRVRGTVKTTLRLECGRCLDMFDFPLNIPIESVLVPAALINGEESRELTDEELDLKAYEGEEFNVDDIVAEHILLVLPVKPLCSKECRGICPKCGVNKNRMPCDCDTDPQHHPFAALKNLKFDC